MLNGGFAMLESLTIEEMHDKYVDQWLLVTEPETDEGLMVQSGKVLFASHDREATYREAIRTDAKEIAIVYTGTMSPDVAVVL